MTEVGFNVKARGILSQVESTLSSFSEEEMPTDLKAALSGAIGEVLEGFGDGFELLNLSQREGLQYSKTIKDILGNRFYLNSTPRDLIYGLLEEVIKLSYELDGENAIITSGNGVQAYMLAFGWGSIQANSLIPSLHRIYCVRYLLPSFYTLRLGTTIRYDDGTSVTDSEEGEASTTQYRLYDPIRELEIIMRVERVLNYLEII